MSPGLIARTIARWRPCGSPEEQARLRRSIASALAVEMTHAEPHHFDALRFMEVAASPEETR